MRKRDFVQPTAEEIKNRKRICAAICDSNCKYCVGSSKLASWHAYFNRKHGWD